VNLVRLKPYEDHMLRGEQLHFIFQFRIVFWNNNNNKKKKRAITQKSSEQKAKKSGPCCVRFKKENSFDCWPRRGAHAYGLRNLMVKLWRSCQENVNTWKIFFKKTQKSSEQKAKKSGPRCVSFLCKNLARA
jgi:hypothetical protein